MSRIFWPISVSPCSLHRLEARRDLVGDGVFHLVGAMRRHGRRAKGLRQVAVEVGHRLPRIAVEHVEHRDRGDEAVVVAAPDRRVEEEMARLLEAGERLQIAHPALDVRMAGLPEVDLDAIGDQRRIGREQAGRFDVDDEGRALMELRQVARQHHADLVGEDFRALVVDHAAAVAVAVEAERDVGARRLHRLRHRVQHVQVFGVGIVARKGPVEVAVERNDLDAERARAACGAKAPAVPLPQAATTFILRVNFGRLVRSAM